MFNHLRDGLAQIVGPVHATPMATARIAQMLAQQAAMLANLDHFLLIAALGALSVVVTLVQRVFRYARSDHARGAAVAGAAAHATDEQATGSSCQRS